MDGNHLALQEMRLTSTPEELAEWLFHHPEALYENGRAHHLDVEVPNAPTWTFKEVAIKSMSFVFKAEKPCASVIIRVKLHGHDPYNVLPLIFMDTPFRVTSHRSWQDIQFHGIIYADDWQSMFVRRKLENC